MKLATNGYVLGDEIQGWHYFAPDEVVLRSEQFAATHCFRLVRDKQRYTGRQFSATGYSENGGAILGGGRQIQKILDTLNKKR